MPSSANPDSFDRPALLNLSCDIEIASRGGVLTFPFRSPSASPPTSELTGINRRPSHLGPSADAFSDFPSRAMPFGDRALLREPIDRPSFGSTPAALTPPPLRSPFSGDLVGREFALFGNSVANADADQDRCDKNAEKYCEVVRPAILSEVREILRLSGGSGPIEDRLSTASETEAIQSRDFLSHRGVREVVFGANSRCRTINGFFRFPSLVRIEIPSSVEIIGHCAFYDCAQLIEVNFEANSHLREIHGFGSCHALSRITIPFSVELISRSAFHECIRLKEVIFEANSRLREIAGFWNCTSLSRMVLPPSLRDISLTAFGGCAGPRAVEFPFGSQFRNNSALRRYHCLVKYRDSDLRHSRRGLHLGLEFR
jgi:hypothetical protein